jgi:hypothetical protein
MIRATKTSNGRQPAEIFYLIYPATTVPITRNKNGVTLREFSDWMKQRLEYSRSPLIYLNSSCWSVRRMPDEISQIHSPYLINIPSFDTVGIFNHLGHNHMRAFLDGIRAGLPFPAIKEKMGQQDYHLNILKDTWITHSAFMTRTANWF